MSGTWQRPNPNGTSETDPNKSVAAEATNARQPMGTSAYTFSDRSADTGKARVEPKPGFSKPDPLGTGTKGYKTRDRAGAQYRITAKMPGPVPESAPTMANARILPPTHGMSGNFYAQSV